MVRRALPSELIPPTRMIAAAWAVVALAYAPAVWMVSAAQGQRGPLLGTLGAMILFFLPWAMITPALLRWSARFPLGLGRTLQSLSGLGLAGLLLIPAVTAVGLTLEWACAALIAPSRGLSLSRIATGVAITSFFSVPIYAAVVGVGQTLLWVERTRERERLLARARLDALRAQINPHFLFNALGAIGELAHRDADAAQKAIACLADVLRSTLDVDVEETSLANEIAIAKDHVELHRLLLPGPLDFRISVSPEAWGARVPVLILQPLIENALVHALARFMSGAWLSITAEVRTTRLWIEVANVMTDTVQPSRGLGSGLERDRV